MNLREAAQQALQAMDYMLNNGEWYQAQERADALRAALAEPVQNPWRCACGANLYIDENGAPRSKAEPEAYSYASRLAVAIWEKHYKATAVNWKPLPDLMGVLTQIDNMTAGLTRQQAESEQEPVAWWKTENFIDPEGLWGERKTFNCEGDGTPLYTHPPRREWRGLTEEEIWQLYYDERVPEGERCDRVDFARAIEAALKERNT